MAGYLSFFSSFAYLYLLENVLGIPCRASCFATFQSLTFNIARTHPRSALKRSQQSALGRDRRERVEGIRNVWEVLCLSRRRALLDARELRWLKVRVLLVEDRAQLLVLAVVRL